MFEARGNELCRHPTAHDRIRDSEKEQVERLARARGAVTAILRVKLAQDIEDRLELRTQPIHPVGLHRRTILREQCADQFPSAGTSCNDCDALDRCLRAKQSDESLKL
jgi:hypothetical protein